jgi:hypothetical protein
MVSYTTMRISKPVRDQLYLLKGPYKDYNTIISELVEKEIESRSHSATTCETGMINHSEEGVIS